MILYIVHATYYIKTQDYEVCMYIPHRTYPCVYRCCVRSRVDDRRDCVAFQRRGRLSARIPGSRSRIRDRPLFLRCLCVLLRSSTGSEFGRQSGPSRRGVDRTVAHFRNPADTVLSDEGRGCPDPRSLTCRLFV